MQSARNEGADQRRHRIRLSRRRRWALAAGGALLLVVAATGGVAAWLAHRAEPYLRARIVEGLGERFHARVELDSFHLSLGNSLRGEWGVWAVGKGLRIWPPAEVQGIAVPATAQGNAKPRAGVPVGTERTGMDGTGAPATEETATAVPVRPLIQLDEFRFHVPLRYQAGRTVHIALIEVNGLNVDLPPQSHFSHMEAKPGAGSAAGARAQGFSVDRIECKRVNLTLETSKPGKLPQVYAITRLRLDGYSSGSAVRFDGDLTIPRPQGAVHTQGSFGPWKVEDPGESVVSGDFTLAHGDLGVFKGIAGKMDASGHYQGTLRDLSVTGVTATPDFRLTHFGTALELRTSFNARVDVTNGDTRLDAVDAQLGRARFRTHGEIVRVAADATHAGGHDIALDVDAKGAPVEEFLKLTSHSGTPLLTGAVTFKAALHIPPGPVPVHQRLRLDGNFTLEQARFSSEQIQKGIEQLSLRAQGRPSSVKNEDPLAVRSQMQGDFHVANASLRLPGLDYSVPGAEIQLHGTYGFDGGTLGFAGTAKMQATVSQMVGGWKGLLLKPVDRLFRKQGAGTAIAIHIRGTREKPDFGVELGGMEVDVSKHLGKKN